MNNFRLFVSAWLLAASSAIAAPATPAATNFATFTTAPAATPAALYSFADIYRLTVNGTALGSFAAMETTGEAPIRVAAPQAAAASEPRFNISPVREPERWLLFVAGLALAGWVAHRRLTHPY